MNIPNCDWKEGKLLRFYQMLLSLQDGKMDVEALLATEYGEELKRRLTVRSYIEDSAALQEEYYSEIGLTYRCFEPESFYERWGLLTPADLRREAAGRRYPVFFWLHGGNNSIESEINMTGLAQIAAREQFLLVYPQNTNWQNVDRLLDYLKEFYPVDPSRVYVGGFSQGGQQAVSCFSHLPWKFAAAVTTGTDVYRPHDNQDVKYTEWEEERLTKYTVPLMQMCGENEPFCYAPLNHYPRLEIDHGLVARYPSASSDTFSDPRKDAEKDPTRIYDPEKGVENAIFKSAGASGQQGKMSSKYNPPEGADVHVWSVERVNHRLKLLGCAPRDPQICTAYRSHPEDVLHNRIGIYGDREETVDYKGLPHYMIEVENAQKIPVFRFVVVHNFTHWIPVSLGEMGWDFCKKFRRNTETGGIEFRQG